MSLSSTVMFYIYQYEKKNFTIVFVNLGLVLKLFFFLAVGHRTPHIAFKSLLKHMYLGYEEIS